MNRPKFSQFIALLSLSLLFGGCGDGNKDKPSGSGGSGAASEDKQLIVYSGRSKNLVEPIFAKFTEATGIEIVARYNSTADLANQILREGDAAQADVFFAQDAGALGYIASKQFLQPIPSEILDMVPADFRSADGSWVGVTGRARVLSYSKERVPAAELPKSIFELTDPKWKGRIGWPPPNASFQAFVTAMRVAHGEEQTEAWLRGVKANEPIDYPKNTPAVEAIANGEIDIALVNHYYLYKLAKNHGGDYPVANHYFEAGDVGSMVNVAGVGILNTTKRPNNAKKFLEYLLGSKAQQQFASANFELPLASGIETSAQLPKSESLHQANIDLAKLDDLTGTITLLRKTGVLP